jgi:hypothetical protein
MATAAMRTAGERMAARCGEAHDGRAEWRGIFKTDEETLRAGRSVGLER